MSLLGGPGFTVYASYSAAIFICAGSGISFGLSTVQELVQKDLEGTSRLKFIQLIWAIQDPGKQWRWPLGTKANIIKLFQPH